MFSILSYHITTSPITDHTLIQLMLTFSNYEKYLLTYRGDILTDQNLKIDGLAEMRRKGFLRQVSYYKLF